MVGHAERPRTDRLTAMATQTTRNPTGLFDPIANDSVAEQVVAQVETLILSGVLKQGARLPSERDLAAQLGVSRPKVREALRLLEERDLITVVPGDGAFIATLSGPAMSPALIALYTRHPAALDDHLEYRRHQESFASRLAAARATTSDRARITELRDAMKDAHQAGDPVRAADLDSEFHLAIVDASHNRTLIHTMTALYALNRSAVFFSRSELLTSEGVSAALLGQHCDIAAAILAGDPDIAAQAAADHIDYVRRAMAEAMGQRRREAVAQKRRSAPETVVRPRSTIRGSSI